jgi:hypothetical protein
MTLLIPKMFINLTMVCCVHKLTCGWGADRANTPPIFLLAKNSQSRMRAVGVRVGGKGCMSINKWFKRIFPILLARLCGD